VRSSYPAGALADLAESLAVGLVAMNSHARTGVARIALGSVTMGVVGMARCPVLVVKTP
jgi:nucleotide-binding universal stress UspA family protein